MKRLIVVLLLAGCGPSFLVGDNYVPSVAHCRQLDAKWAPYCEKCFRKENGVFQYHSATLMTSEGYGCESFFAHPGECPLLADPAARSECSACVAQQWYYRADAHHCEQPSSGP